jgi:hypothetical protein
MGSVRKRASESPAPADVRLTLRAELPSSISPTSQEEA